MTLSARSKIPSNDLLTHNYVRWLTNVLSRVALCEMLQPTQKALYTEVHNIT